LRLALPVERNWESGINGLARVIRKFTGGDLDLVPLTALRSHEYSAANNTRLLALSGFGG
jgi:hypothetical protein